MQRPLFSPGNNTCLKTALVILLRGNVNSLFFVTDQNAVFVCFYFQSTFVNRPALGILPPHNFPDKLTESLLSVSNMHINFLDLYFFI